MKIGYEAGRGRTFTPSTNANWTDEFNVLLNSSDMSRNALTEKLIEEGLKNNKRDHILLETQGLSPRQAEILNSEAGQEILKNVLKLLLGESSSVVSSLAATVTSSGDYQMKDSVPIEPLKENDDTRTTSLTTSAKPTSALDKLRAKKLGLDQAKQNL